MSSNETEIFKSWGQTLTQARTSQNRDSGTLARELMLSAAQIQGIEAGQTQAFHAQNYYLRGVQRYADALGITLEPPVASLQQAQHPVTHRAASIAQRHCAPVNAPTLPEGRTHGIKPGRWLLLVLILLGAAGIYLSLNEGWPERAITALQKSAEPEADATLDTAASMFAAPVIDEQALVNQVDQPAQHTAAAPPPVAAPAAPAAPLTPPAPAAPAAQPATTLSQALTPPAQPPALPDPTPSPAPETTTQPATVEPLSPTATVQTPPAPTSEPSSATVSSAVAPVIDTTTTPAPEQPAASIPAPSTSPTPTEPSVLPNASNSELVLSFHEECWVEWRLNDGQTQQRIYQPGEQLRLPVDQVQRLVLGNARSIQAQVANQPLELQTFIRGTSTVARIDGSALQQAIRSR